MSRLATAHCNQIPQRGLVPRLGLDSVAQHEAHLGAPRRQSRPAGDRHRYDLPAPRPSQQVGLDVRAVEPLKG